MKWIAILLSVCLFAIPVLAEEIEPEPTPTPILVFDNVSGNIFTMSWETSVMPKTLQGQPVWFYSKSYNASNWFWDFGDNSFSTKENPYHVYNRSGCYSVRLNVSNSAFSGTNLIVNHLCMRLGL